MWNNRYDKSLVHRSADPVVIPNYLLEGISKLVKHTDKVDVKTLREYLENGNPNVALAMLREVPPAGLAGICASELMRDIISELNSGHFC